MKITTGHPVTADVAPVDASRVRFVVKTDHGEDRCMFEVSVGDDGISIEVRAIEMVKFGGVIYEGRILVAPNSANSVTIRPSVYRDGR